MWIKCPRCQENQYINNSVQIANYKNKEDRFEDEVEAYKNIVGGGVVARTAFKNKSFNNVISPYQLSMEQAHENAYGRQISMQCRVCFYDLKAQENYKNNEVNCNDIVYFSKDKDNTLDRNSSDRNALGMTSKQINKNDNVLHKWSDVKQNTTRDISDCNNKLNNIITINNKTTKHNPYADIKKLIDKNASKKFGRKQSNKINNDIQDIIKLKDEVNSYLAESKKSELVANDIKLEEDIIPKKVVSKSIWSIIGAKTNESKYTPETKEKKLRLIEENIVTNQVSDKKSNKIMALHNESISEFVRQSKLFSNDKNIQINEEQKSTKLPLIKKGAKYDLRKKTSHNLITSQKKTVKMGYNLLRNQYKILTPARASAWSFLLSIIILSIVVFVQQSDYFIERYPKSQNIYKKIGMYKDNNYLNIKNLRTSVNLSSDGLKLRVTGLLENKEDKIITVPKLKIILDEGLLSSVIIVAPPVAQINAHQIAKFKYDIPLKKEANKLTVSFAN